MRPARRSLAPFALIAAALPGSRARDADPDLEFRDTAADDRRDADGGGGARGQLGGGVVFWPALLVA